MRTPILLCVHVTVLVWAGASILWVLAMGCDWLAMSFWLSRMLPCVQDKREGLAWLCFPVGFSPNHLGKNFGLEQIKHPALKCWPCLPVVPQHVCACICMCLGLISVPWHTLRRCCEASLSEMCKVLWEVPLKGFKIHRSEAKLQWTPEDPLLWCHWAKMIFVSLREFNFIVLSLITMLWIDFSRNWDTTVVTILHMFLCTVSPRTPFSPVLVDTGMVKIIGQHRDNFNYILTQAWNSAVAQPVRVHSGTPCSTRTYGSICSRALINIALLWKAKQTSP